MCVVCVFPLFLNSSHKRGRAHVCVRTHPCVWLWLSSFLGLRLDVDLIAHLVRCGARTIRVVDAPRQALPVPLARFAVARQFSVLPPMALTFMCTVSRGSSKSRMS